MQNNKSQAHRQAKKPYALQKREATKPQHISGPKNKKTITQHTKRPNNLHHKRLPHKLAKKPKQNKAQHITSARQTEKKIQKQANTCKKAKSPTHKPLKKTNTHHTSGTKKQNPSTHANQKGKNKKQKFIT